MAKRFAVLILGVLLILSAPHAAASDVDGAAAEYVVANSIYIGDQNGDMRWSSGLTRAELAVVLTRLRGDENRVKADIEHYSFSCWFTDVPEWAKPYVGYCGENYLMNGYNLFSFGPEDAVTPQAACTVMLRHLGYAETDWDYNTACEKAVEVGIADNAMLTGTSISRLNVALIIYRVSLIEGTPSEPTPGGYTVAAPREDFSQQANPGIFTELLNRDVYNVFRQTILDSETIVSGNDATGLNPSYTYAACETVQDGAQGEMYQIALQLSGYYTYQRANAPDSLYGTESIVAVTTALPATDDATEEMLLSIAALSDREKVKAINDYLCELIIYDMEVYNTHTVPGILETFTGEWPIRGVCDTYSKSFMYLCSRVGIPCIRLTGDTASGLGHTWNAVYVDGEWLYVDVTYNDLDSIQIYGNEPVTLYGVTFLPGQTITKADVSPDVWQLLKGEPPYLLSDSHLLTDRNPSEVVFVQELLVPGSTIK